MAKPKGAAEPNDELPTTREATATGPAGQPARIGKYVIEKRLGAGGMGAVYLAVDSTLKRQVALKVLPKDKAGNPTLVKRFKAEALAAAHLRHENIVTIYEAGDADGYSYIALEFVDGTDVANLVKKRGLIPVKRSIDIVRQTVRALDHAFQHKIVHRDIKPGNILVRRDGMVKLADMGLARVVDETMDTSITRTGTTVGTVDFMAPEQARNSKLADIRSDIYSLGCTWFYMLTGSVPYPEGSVTNKLRAHAEAPLPDPRGANPLVPDSVVAVMRRMTEKDPARRYQRPSELLADLAAAEGEQKHVSDSILSEDAVPGDTQASDAETLSTPRRPRTVADLPVTGRKSPKAEDSEKRSELANAVAFYAVVGLAGVLLVAGIV